MICQMDKDKICQWLFKEWPRIGLVLWPLSHQWVTTMSLWPENASKSVLDCFYTTEVKRSREVVKPEKYCNAACFHCSHQGEIPITWDQMHSLWPRSVAKGVAKRQGVDSGWIGRALKKLVSLFLPLWSHREHF